MPIYTGQTPSSEGISLQAWGSGVVTEDDKTGFDTSHSIEITSPSLFAGGFLTFKNPIEIADPAVVGQFDYIEVQVKFNTTIALGISPSGGAAAPGVYQPLPLDIVGGNYDFDELPMVPKARNLKMIIYSEDGRALEHKEPIVLKPTDEEGWIGVAFPLASFGLTADSGGFKLTKMALSCDFPDSFWVGQIQVVTDSSPIFVEALGGSESVAPYDSLVFKANAEAGRTSLLYSWDFNAKDGIQEDATGQYATVSYSAPGEYTITLTVKDPDGLKKPASVKASVDVTGS